MVTGASGFVGKSLIASLESDGIPSIGVFRDKRSSSDRAVHVSGIDAATNWEGKLNNVSCIVHCAAKVHIFSHNNQSLKALYDINLDGTLNLAKSAAKAGVKRFIFLSSIKVNGESTCEKTPFRQSNIPDPQDPYGKSKALAESALLNLGTKTDMEIVILRPPLVYGPGVKANFAAICKLISKRLPLPFGLIRNNRRSMVYIKNLVSLIRECIVNDRAPGNIFLVSDNEDLSLVEFVNKLGASYGIKPVLLPIPGSLLIFAGVLLRQSLIVERLIGSLQVDITYTCEVLQWSPPYSVQQGFNDTAQFFTDEDAG